MSERATGKSRSFSPAGRCVFGHDPDILTDTIGMPSSEQIVATGQSWNYFADVRYFGTCRAQGRCTVAGTVDLQTVAGVHQWRSNITVTMSLSLLRFGAAGASNTFTTNVLGSWNNVPTDGASYNYLAFCPDAHGHADLTETDTLFEWEQVAASRDLYEKLRCDGASLAGTLTGNFQVVQRRATFGGTPTWSTVETPAATVTGTITYAAEASGTRRRIVLTEYEWDYPFANKGPLQDLAPQFDYGGDGTLSSLYGSVSEAAGRLQISGTPGAPIIHWNGTAADYAYHQTPPDAFAVWVQPPGSPPGSANLVLPSGTTPIPFRPSWAVAASARALRFGDGADLPMGTELRWTGTVGGAPKGGLLGSFTTPAGFARYPASGWAHYVNGSITEGAVGEYDSASGFLLHVYSLGTPLVTAQRTGALSDATPLFWPQPADRPAGTMTAAGMTLAPAKSWADASGHYTDSDNPPASIRRVRLPVQVCGPFVATSIEVLSSWRFNLMEASGKWGKQSGASFLAANTGYGTGCTLSTVAGLDGNALQVAVTTPKCLIGTVFGSGYWWKPWGYRYARIAVRASVAGARVNLWVDDVTNDDTSHWFGKWGWQFTVTAANTWEVKTFDLARPALLATGAGVAVSSAAYTGALHWDQYLRRPTVPFRTPGASVWLEFLDTATYLFDYLEGYLDSGAGRTCLRVWEPMDGKGDVQPLLQYEGTRNPSGQPYWLRLAANGMRSLTYPTDGTIQTTINDLYNDLSNAQDTGIIVPLPSTDVLFDAEQAGDMQGQVHGLPFVQTPGAGATLNLVGQHRAPGFVGYYGMGAATGGAYDRLLTFFGDVTWDGELCGLALSSTNPSGATLTLRDNPTQSTLASTTPDTDGFYSLPAPYGVLTPFSSPAWTSGLEPALANHGSAEYTAGPVYTSLGNLLNSHWLYGLGVTDPEDGSGYLLDGASRFAAVLLDQWPTWKDLHAHAQTKSGVSNLAIGWGFYWSTYADGGNIVVRRADRGHPPFDMVAVVTSLGTDSEPRLVDDAHGGLFLLFTRSGTDVYWARCAGNDGASFSMPTILFAGGTHPAAACDRLTGRIIHGAYVAGKLAIRVQANMESAPGAAFNARSGGADLLLEDDSFGLYFVEDEERRLNLDVRILGESGPSTLWSASEGATWTRY